jgi:hypothetical protein
MWKLGQNHKKLKTKACMCKQKKKKKIYCDKIWKHKHKKNKPKLWNKIVFQIDVEHIKNNWVLISIYTHLET